MREIDLEGGRVWEWDGDREWRRPVGSLVRFAREMATEGHTHIHTHKR